VDKGENRLASSIEANLDYVDPMPQRKGRPGDLPFRSMPAHAQTRYAAGLEKMSILDIPATFGEVAKNEWAKALTEWVKFGSYKYMTHNLVWVNGELTKEPVYIDDVTNPKKFDTLTENQKYWTNRWSDQMNYRYWKDRSKAEMTSEGVEARQLFYNGTIAYKGADFPKAVESFRNGLNIWDALLKQHNDYRTDEFNKKDTGLIVKRYLRALRQLGEPEPKDLPFRELLAGAEQDSSVDPFDQTEMLGVDRASKTPAPSNRQRPAPTPAPIPSVPAPSPSAN
jgi:hypothetical protein